ncbi:MAG: phosphate/phosphite/phosphonate ABC transporter substrate-binding protein [Hyphomicrobiales bacterium]
MISSLGMYDFEEVRWATNALWSAIACVLEDEGFDDVPKGLERARLGNDIWTANDLLIAQTCGYPLMTSLKGRCAYVATPCYGVEGCEGANYSSVILARAGDGPQTLEDARGLRAAVNGPDSMSGHIALKAAFAPYTKDESFFGSAIVTGRHTASMEAVRDGEGDVCAIDCVTYALAERYRSDLCKGLKKIGSSPAAPGLPLITSLTIEQGGEGGPNLERLRKALKTAYLSPETRDAREALFITGLVNLNSNAYMRILEIEEMGSGLNILP